MKRYRKPGPPLRHFMRDWREARGITMDQMAERIGLSKSTLSRIETGLQPYYQDVVEAYAEQLRISPCELIGHKPGNPESIFEIWNAVRDDRRAEALGILRLLIR